MAAGGGSPPPGVPPSTLLSQQREARWLSSEYGDETKLRQLSAKQTRIATKNAQRVARLNTRIDKLRHHAAVLREKAAAVRGAIPPIAQEIDGLRAQVQQATGGNPTANVDVTRLQLRARKLEQKRADRLAKSARLEEKAASATQHATELKIRADRFAELQRTAEAEANAYRQRADNLQLARQPPTAGGGAPPP